MYLHKRTFIRIISFFSVAVIALAVFGVYNYNQQNRIKNSLMSDYARSFTDLSAHLYNIETAFDRAGTPARLPGRAARKRGLARDGRGQERPGTDARLRPEPAGRLRISRQGGRLRLLPLGKTPARRGADGRGGREYERVADTASSLAAYIGGLQSEINDETQPAAGLAVIDEHAGDQPADEGRAATSP